jgi:LysR family transcriptional regulator (chromosome initiation inhibitor)
MSLLSPQLEAFAAIVKHSTVHAAAKELGITQTGVTQRIRALESMLSTTLFIRSRRGMTPTPEGEALLRYCHAARDLEGEALAKIQKAAIQTEVRVRITGPSSIMRSRVIPQCLPVMETFPQLLVSCNILDLGSRADELRNGSAQLAILEPEHVSREMDSKLLKPERYLLVGSARWKKRDLKDILRSERIIDFDPTDTMSFNYLRKFKLLELARTERHFVNNTESLATLLIAGRGYGVLTAEFAKPYLERGELAPLNSGLALENPLALAWYPRQQAPGYFSALVRAIK